MISNQSFGRRSGVSVARLGFCRIQALLFHLGLELSRAPARVTDKGANRRRIFAHALVRFIHVDVVIQPQPHMGKIRNGDS